MISRELEQWVRSTWKDCVELVEVQKLIGGISSSIYRVDVRNQATGGMKSFVLRSVLPSDGLNEEQGILAKEAVVLKQLAALSEAGLLDQPEAVDKAALDEAEHTAIDSTADAVGTAVDTALDKAVVKTEDTASDNADTTSEKAVIDKAADTASEKAVIDKAADTASDIADKASELAKLTVSFPRCIAYDASGECAGVPALLMTYVPGKVSLPVEPSPAWLQELARAIGQVHAATAHRSVVPWNYYRYAAAGLDQHPALQWSKHPERWLELINYVSQPEPSYVSCLIHRDYHPTNVLWDDNQQQVLSIVDWVNGCMGPAGVDVGHCRSNLIQLYGLRAANAFLEAYIQANPTFHYEPYWDICSLIDMTFYGPVEVYEGWTVLGFQGLTADAIQQRIEQYVEDLVQLLHTNRYRT